MSTPEPRNGNAPAPVRGARAAVVFLTRVPLGGFPYREADWRWAAAWFPVVGALVGAVAVVRPGSWSRAAPVWLMAALPYVTPAESARSGPVTRTGAPQAAIAAAVAALITAAALASGRLGLRAGLALPLVSAAVALA